MKLRLATLLASSFAIIHSAIAETRDLLIIAGQSNAVGFDAIPSLLPADAADADVLFWFRCGDPPPDDHDVSSARHWTHLQPQPKGSPRPRGAKGSAPDAERQYGNFANAGGGFGPEFGLARTLRAKSPGPLAIVKVAFSGTAVSTDWSPTDPGDAGACYRALLSETRAAVAAADKKGIALRFRALVWVQGESDARPKADVQYEQALGSMLAALRKDLDAPELTVLLGVNTRFGNGKNPHVPVIVAAQKALAASLPRCAYVDTVGAETLPPSHTHFTAAGTLEVGRRFAEALLTMEKAAPAR